MIAPSQKLTFPGAHSAPLSALLNRPFGPIRGTALFAHCFTCSKDIFAAERIAAALTGRGIAVLRFDFTGLGASGGEFADTNFSSNIADLLAAAAVLAAAGEIPEVRAVATIGAPADAKHVIQNFAADLDRIEEEGAAEVTLAGRHFIIQRRAGDRHRGRDRPRTGRQARRDCRKMPGSPHARDRSRNCHKSGGGPVMPAEMCRLPHACVSGA